MMHKKAYYILSGRTKNCNKAHSTRNQQISIQLILFDVLQVLTLIGFFERIECIPLAWINAMDELADDHAKALLPPLFDWHVTQLEFTMKEQTNQTTSWGKLL